jgi:RND superfamily putative drug exporter
MPRLLSRLAGACARRAWWTLIAWGLALLAVGTAAAAEGRELSNVFNISTRAADLAARVQAELPEAAGATGQIVYTTADGAGFTDLQKQQIASELDDVRQVPGVVEVIDPFETEAYRDELMAAFLSGQLPADQLAYYQQVGQAAMGYRVVSTDGTTAVATVVFEYGPYEVPADVKKLVQRAAGWSVGGVRTDFSQELVLDIEALMGPAEIVGVLMAGVVLLIMLGSLVAAGLPLLAAGLGVGTAVLGALAFAGTVHMTSTTLILGIMLGLAVGIDYSLFIINRHRRRLRELADLGALGAPGHGRAGVR